MSWVEEVLSSLRIVLGRTERGRVWAICPWHQEPDSPPAWATAFFVRLSGTRRGKEGGRYDAAGQCHCFACGEGGSIRDLVVKVRGCDEAEAREFVRKRGGNAGGSRVEELRRVVTVVRRERLGRPRFRVPPEVLFDPLERWISGAREEVERRGVTAEEVRDYGLGYAVDGRKLGCRVVVPWRDGAGRVGSYTARTFVGDEPKYTTPGPEDYPDREVLFGEHLWPALGRDRAVVVVTEGAFNAMAARRVFPELQVGAVGGADNFDVGQARKLATFRAGLLLSDPDEAGDKLARRIEMTLGARMRLSRVELPPGKDAEDAGPERLRRAIEVALRRLPG